MSDERIQNIDEDSLARAAELIAAGELIVVPTDTVYGVACDPFNSNAIDKLFEVKRRPRTKSIQVLLPDLSALPGLGLSLPHPLEILSDALLPGGFSPICNASNTSSLASLRHEAAEDGTSLLTQGIRVPDFLPLHRILKALGPLAATSANLSGHESATSAQQAFDSLGTGVGLYLDAGATPGPVSSTVVGASASAEDGIVILREGVIPATTIRSILHL
ncbi:MAG: threonylcarbamoyl-AMP synthase [Bifidobacteriaceae bacterium]|jgi:tRNA threonylcarbamoyl adenosine modification protein (Sua5/YciO/YrdC/YwlC family)|nr:threonylcarbamoyl-AMP synthase [Bifidobacteriaceae bacterium]MCI1914950.1 threonylcarbamoyl-AMP synthase [Bifidobacteriaceae bacterium]